MNRTSMLHRGLAALALAAGAAAAMPALAGPSSTAAMDESPAARYQRERQACLDGTNPQDRATCLREAGAARVEAMRGGLDTPDASTLERNALERCKVHKADDERAACERMMRGEGTVSGSVAGGGLLRELVTTEPAAANAAPMH